jgi:hypothetical protein
MPTYTVINGFSAAGAALLPGQTTKPIHLTHAGTAPDPLVYDLVEWIAKEPRPYADVIDAWRTSCPRLTVWEDAVDRGLVKRESVEGHHTRVVVTAAGREYLRERQ